MLIPFEGKARVYRGHEEVREMVGDVYDAWTEINTEYSEIRDLGDRIVASVASAPVAGEAEPTSSRRSLR